jgi:ABC-type nitrate/sulfonate/bicarbonate transport system permease component
MLAIGFIGKVIDVILKTIERKMIKWNTKYQGN